MIWHSHAIPQTSHLLHAVQTLTVTQAWLKNVSRQLAAALSTQPECFVDAVTETLVSYPTVHHIDHFQHHYQQAVAFLHSLNHQLDDDKDIYVLWLPSANGYCTCAFLMPVMGEQTTVIVTPEPLPMLQAA